MYNNTCLIYVTGFIDWKMYYNTIFKNILFLCPSNIYYRKWKWKGEINKFQSAICKRKTGKETQVRIWGRKKIFLCAFQWIIHGILFIKSGEGTTVICCIFHIVTPEYNKNNEEQNTTDWKELLSQLFLWFQCHIKHD